MKIFDTRLILKNSIESINKLLHDNLNIQFLEVVDESAEHAGHAGVRDSFEMLTHVCVRICAAELLVLSRVARHRKLYSILQPAIDNGLHAIRFDVL